ncbi:acyl-homoserine-lactone synthase [Yoonia sp. GPGPB17]|uniref:acyl-homoserine-lactone synthase n=1 Tax=Yoonia sp. GPGPB17 TaxID=3026147 RepID=UPI0030C426AF
MVYGYYRLRSDVFVGKLGWPLEVTGENVESEQYDAAPIAHYVIAHDHQTVVGGARLVNCSLEFGHGRSAISYMIRDAFLGRISLPSEIWADGEPPTDDKTWELTRLVSVDKNPETTKNILGACNEYIKRMGAERCLFLTNPLLLKIGKRYGYDPIPRGPVLSNDDGRFLAFECPVR